MTVNGWLQIFFFLGLIFLVTKPMGIFMARVFSREKTFMDPVLRPLERLLYRVTGVDEDHEMRIAAGSAAGADEEGNAEAARADKGDPHVALQLRRRRTLVPQ